MLGLIEKDIRLMLQRKSSLLMVAAFAVMMSFTMDVGFVVGYLVVLGVSFSSSTISYDEFDNGYPFLMTLPIEKKTYVAEKYIFCLSTGFILWFFASLLYFITLVFRGISADVNDVMIQLCVFLPVIVLLTAIIIPFFLKYGSERGRIIMFLFCGFIFAGGTLIGMVLKQRMDAITKMFEFVKGISDAGVVSIIIVITLLILIISYCCSKHIMEKKEY